MGFYTDIPEQTTNEASQVTVTGHRYLAGEELASWHRRAVSFLIDAWPLWLAMFVILPLMRREGWPGQSWETAVTWFFLALTVLSLSGLGQGEDASYQRSYGQRLMGLIVLRPIITPHGAHWVWTKPAPHIAILRAALHALDVPFMFGFLRPLWHRHHATFADSLTACVVMRCSDPAALDIKPAQRGVLVTKVQ